MTAAVPTVSVIMATYNGARLLPETIASLRAQTMTDFEVVVVDDCSTDHSVALLEAIDEPRLRVFRSAVNGGPAVARTAAMGHARGRYVAGLDQDDLCRPDRFARQIAYLDDHPNTVLVASAAEPLCEGAAPPDIHAGLTDPGAIDWWMTILNPIVWSSVMMRGEAARALDPFERDLVRCAEDFDLYHRIRAFGRIARIDDPLVRYRHHAGGLSQASQGRMIESAAAVLAERHGSLFGEERARVALLLSRHAGARQPPPDAAVLAEIGGVLVGLLDAFGHLSPDRAAIDSETLWWRIARSGLRAGRYGVGEMVQARRSFGSVGTRPSRIELSVDAVIGAGRRLARR